MQPVLFWVLFGAGLSGSFRMPGVEAGLNYQAYFIPGVAAMIVLFTAIFATISLIEDRDAGFLQGVLASSAPRLAVVLGKVGGGATLAFAQAALFLLLAGALPELGVVERFGMLLSPARIVGLVAFLAVLSVALTALGYCIAWPSRSTQGYHAIMSVVLFPMWLLSGAFFPAEGAGWLGRVIAANPLTYGVAGLRRYLFPPETIAASAPSLAVCWGITLAFASLCVTLGVWMTRRPSAN